jgi:hypothetical protein
MKNFILILALASFTLGLQAQQRFSNYRHSQSSSGFRGVTLGIGGAFPSFDYYSDTDYEFDFSPMVSLGGEFWISKPLAVRAGGSYLTSTGTTTGEETKISQLSGTLDGLLYFSKTSRFSRSPQPMFYLGLGAEFIQLTVDYTPEGDVSQTLNGGTTVVRLLGGFEYPVTPQIKIGAEIQYGIGNYEQGFIISSTEVLEEIDISGARAMLTLKYIVNDYSPRSKRSRYR